MSEKVYTEAQMKAAIKSAFESGKEWATCYISWFTPSPADHNKHRGQAIRKAMKAAEQERAADVVSPAEEKEYLAEMNKVASELLG